MFVGKTQKRIPFLPSHGGSFEGGGGMFRERIYQLSRWEAPLNRFFISILVSEWFEGDGFVDFFRQRERCFPMSSQRSFLTWK